MSNHTTQQIVAGTNASTSATTKRHSSHAYLEGDVDGAGKVSVLESGGSGKVAQQKKNTTPSPDPVANGVHNAQPTSVFPPVCAYVQHCSPDGEVPRS